MKNSFQSLGRRGKVGLLAGAFAIGGLIVALQGAQTGGNSNAALSLKRDEQPVNRSQMEPASFAAIVRKVAPSVVTINVEGRVQGPQQLPIDDPFLRQFFGGRIPEVEPQPQSGLGSGVIISADGYIATNNHVVADADRIFVTLNDGRVFKDARIVGRDPQTEVAVIKIDATNLPAITLADSSKVEVGDRVLAIGNPFGLAETVTSGIVSATGRSVNQMRSDVEYQDWIQTDAAINPGNSGGALIDVQGRLIGLNTAIIGSGASNGIGLAVPSNLVSFVANSLVQNGTVVRSMLGVRTQFVTPELMEAYGVKTRGGALVQDVIEGTPAEKAGVMEEDVIVAVDGKPVADSSKLSLMISQLAPGTQVELEVIRNGASKTLKAKTEPKEQEVVAVNTPAQRGMRRNNSAASPANPRQGFRQYVAPATNSESVLDGVAVRDLAPNLRRQLGVPSDVRGALIDEVAPGSPSARAGLSSGQVILSINGTPVDSADKAIELTDKPASRKTRVRVWDPRGGTMTTVVDETVVPNSR